MKIFFDAEFTGLHKNTTLISLAMVSEDGHSLYVEFTDYDFNQVDEWIEKNVLENTINLKAEPDLKIKFDFQRFYPDCEYFFGSKNTLKPFVVKWLEKFSDIELVADVGHYDVVLLIDFLYGTALQSPICTYIDVNTLIANEYNISINEAFDKSREEIAQISENDFAGLIKHNALYDTLVLKRVFNTLNKKEKTKKKRKITRKKEN